MVYSILIYLRGYLFNSNEIGILSIGDSFGSLVGVDVGVCLRGLQVVFGGVINTSASGGRVFLFYGLLSGLILWGMGAIVGQRITR